MPGNRGFGSGPANEHGLRLQPHPTPEGDGAEATWTADERYASAYPGVLHGGIVSTLLDEIGGWAVMVAAGGEPRVPLVLAEYTVRLRRPTPTGQPLRVCARVAETDERGAWVEAAVELDGEVTATARGRYVRISV